MNRPGFYAFVFLSLSLAVPSTWAAPDSNLRSMACTKLVVEDLSQGARQLGLDAENLRDRLTVAIKSKIPRLPLKAACESSLYLTVTTITLVTVSGTPRGYAASIGLELERIVTIEATKDIAVATVWRRGGINSGPLDDVSEVYLQIEDLATAFAAAYYEAGNP